MLCTQVLAALAHIVLVFVCLLTTAPEVQLQVGVVVPPGFVGLQELKAVQAPYWADTQTLTD